MAKDPTLWTVNPEDPEGSKVEATIPFWWASKLYKTSPVDFENLRAVKFVLENVDRIFRDIREFNKGGWCFTGRPERWCIRNESIEVPFPPEHVLAVYMNPRLWVFDFQAERASPDDPCSPVDWQNRYGALIWKSTSSKT